MTTNHTPGAGTGSHYGYTKDDQDLSGLVFVPDIPDTPDNNGQETFETLEASKRRGELHAKSAIPRAKQKRDSRNALMLGAVAAQICT